VSATSLKLLSLPAELHLQLEQAGCQSIEFLRDSTVPQLQRLGLSVDHCSQVLASLDFYYDRRFRSDLLGPNLPEPCFYVNCAFLELPEDLLAQLEEKGFEYLYELALSRRYPLGQIFAPAVLTELEFALLRFVQAWREEEIVLEIEEEDV